MVLVYQHYMKRYYFYIHETMTKKIQSILYNTRLVCRQFVENSLSTVPNLWTNYHNMDLCARMMKLWAIAAYFQGPFLSYIVLFLCTLAGFVFFNTQVVGFLFRTVRRIFKLILMWINFTFTNINIVQHKIWIIIILKNIIWKPFHKNVYKIIFKNWHLNLWYSCFIWH